MSGKKRTQAELNHIAEALVQAKFEKEASEKRTYHLFQQIEKLLNTIKDTSISDSLINSRLTLYEAQLKVESSKLSERQTELKTIKVPDSIGNQANSFVDSIRQKINDINNECEDLSKLLKTINFDIINICEADQTLSGILFAMQNYENGMNSNAELLKTWFVNDFQKIKTLYESNKEKVRVYKISINNQQTTGETVRNFKDIEVYQRKVSDELYRLIAEANKKEELQQKRLYIIASVRQVCADLGFKEISNPSYEQLGNCNSTIFQTFDLRDQTTITFKFHLDNHIESDSGISIDGCAAQFRTISDLLLSGYGAQTKFERINPDEIPKDEYDSEKSIPQTQAKTMEK
jgi:hypothetical protein